MFESPHIRTHLQGWSIFIFPTEVWLLPKHAQCHAPTRSPSSGSRCGSLASPGYASEGILQQCMLRRTKEERKEDLKLPPIKAPPGGGFCVCVCVFFGGESGSASSKASFVCGFVEESCMSPWACCRPSWTDLASGVVGFLLDFLQSPFEQVMFFRMSFKHHLKVGVIAPTLRHPALVLAR